MEHSRAPGRYARISYGLVSRQSIPSLCMQQRKCARIRKPNRSGIITKSRKKRRVFEGRTDFESKTRPNFYQWKMTPVISNQCFLRRFVSGVLFDNTDDFLAMIGNWCYLPASWLYHVVNPRTSCQGVAGYDRPFLLHGCRNPLS